MVTSNTRLKLGIDVDGVLASFERGFIPLLRRLTGKRHIPDTYEPEVWDWPEKVGYTKEEISSAWKFIKQDSMFWYALPLMPDAPAFLRALKDSPHDVYFITNRMGDRAKFQTEMWLEPYYPHATVLLTAAKGLAARTLSLDAYIDDKRENCMEVWTTGARVYMPRKFYNVLAEPVPGITQIYSILEMLEHERIFYSLSGQKRAA